jgi:AcrR family transcriptional regulator
MKQKQKKPVGTRRQKQKEETRDIILESARSLFAELGYEKTNIRAVARKAGVGLGTIFNHFPDKSSLLIAALLDDLEKTQAKAIKTLPLKATVCEKFLHGALIFYSYYARRPSLSRTLLKEMWFTTGKWAEDLKAQKNRFIVFLTDTLKEAKEQGEILPEADCQLAAIAFFSHYMNTLYWGLSEPEFKPAELIDLLRNLLNQIMEGIGTNQTTSK